jgi:hypothetical protein
MIKKYDADELGLAQQENDLQTAQIVIESDGSITVKTGADRDDLEQQQG